MKSLLERKLADVEEKYLKRMQHIWIKFPDAHATIYEKFDTLLLKTLEEAGFKKIVSFYEECKDIMTHGC